MSTQRIRGEDGVMKDLVDIAAMTGRSLFEELKTTGRALCKSLAFSTWPYGLNKRSQSGGEKKIEKDMANIFITPAGVYEELMRDSGKPLADAFWIAHKAKVPQRMETIIRKTGISVDPMAALPPGIHWKAGSRKIFPTRSKHRERYVAKVKKQVGKAKAGWSLASDACGGHRGIPLWATGRRHPDAKGGADLNPSEFKPSVTIWNRVSYIEECLPQRSITTATRIAHEKLAKRVSIIARKSRHLAA